MRWIVYETRCLVSGRIYVGVHRQDGDGFDGYLGSGKALTRAIKKHGVENFERRTLEEFSVEAEAYAREAEIVTEEFCKRRDNYNMKPGGAGGFPELTAEIIEKRRQANLGKKRSPETREKIRQAQNTPEARERKRQASLGRKHSPKSREKIRQASLGRKHSPKSREKMRQAKLGKALSPKTRERMRQAHLGRKHSPEARENMRKAALCRWAERRANAA